MLRGGLSRFGWVMQVKIVNWGLAWRVGDGEGVLPFISEFSETQGKRQSWTKVSKSFAGMHHEVMAFSDD